MAHCDGDAFCLPNKEKNQSKNKRQQKIGTQQAAQTPACELAWRWRGVLLKCMIPTHEQREIQRNYDDDCSTGATPSLPQPATPAHLSPFSDQSDFSPIFGFGMTEGASFA